MAKIDKERFISLRKELMQDSDTQREVLSLIDCSMRINSLKREQVLLRDKIGSKINVRYSTQKATTKPPFVTKKNQHT